MAYQVGKKVQEAGLIIGGLGVIGFIGIIWLMIYGNLSGNLGFGSDTASFSNETILLDDDGYAPATAQNRSNIGTLSSIIITNASTGGEVVPTTNYTIVGVTITANSTEYWNGTNVNVSGIVTFDSTGKASTENVITNISGGFLTFFGFSNTFFTIAAIVLLIFMLVGLLAIVMMIVNMQRGKKAGGFSGN